MMNTPAPPRLKTPPLPSSGETAALAPPAVASSGSLPAALRNPQREPTPGSPRDRDNRYYRLLAGGARTRLLEAFLEVGLPELLGKTGPLTAAAICSTLQWDSHRGWKFLHLLAMNGLLTECRADFGDDDALFELSSESRKYFGETGTEGYFFRDLVQYWRNVAELPIRDVLRGLALPEAVRWPPPNAEAAEHLETWMRVTAEGAIRTLVNSGTLRNAQRLLDVGGGDGTIGCALVTEYPALQVTVFNLPASAALARQNIASRGCTERVQVHAGDFLHEELPGGFDRVMFSRVLTDWTPHVCRQLLEKARRALLPGGKLIINEALVDGNEDYALSWEFRYLFYDSFGRAMFKPLRVYEELLRQAGFEPTRVSPMIDEAFYHVIEAQPRD